MGKKKSAYIGYTEQEVERMERNYYCVQFGGDFLCDGDFFLFTKIEVVKVYNNTLKDLVGIIRDGTEKDRKYALDLIAGLRVQQMRLH